jgi:hypothetical protein
MKIFSRIIVAMLIVMVCTIFLSCANKGEKTNLPNQSPENILVGVQYFSGWWSHSPNKWEYRGTDWRSEYPDRVPLLGEYNTQETMDKEIKAAADHGVDFFSILYYYGGNVTNREKKDVPYLNSGLTFFLESGNAHMMKFMIELTNHPPFDVTAPEDWDECMDVFIEAMKHPSYLKIDGRAVLKIHAGDQFYIDMGNDVVKCRNVIKQLRERARNAGIGELLITVGTYGKGPINESHHFSKIGEIDGTMQYMGVPELPSREKNYPYEDLVAEATSVRDVRKSDVLNWVPYFPAGWNPRPWHDDRPKFELPNREQWEKGLKDLKSDLLKYSNLGFPKKDGTTQKAFTIYAWNEFGEGGFVAPTVGDQYMKLEVIKEIFGEE